MQYLRNASPSSQPDSKSLLLTGDVLEDNLFWVSEEQGSLQQAVSIHLAN